VKPPLRHALLALAFFGTYGFTHAVAPVAPAVPATLSELPMTLASWSGVTAPALPPEIMKTLAADDYIRRYYYAQAEESARQTSEEGSPALSQPVEMDVSYYTQPRVGANMHSPLNCLPGNGWQITQLASRPLAGLDDVHVQALTVQRGEHRFAMAYWFQSRDRVITGEAAARFKLLSDALQRRPNDASVVRVMLPISDAPTAHAAVLAFASRLVPELSKVLGGA
jgi:EpsI family protein